MAAQMKATNKKTKKNNIAKFRQDYRLLVVGAFRGLGLLVMLAVLVFSIVTYQDYLNPASLRQGLRYLGATASRGEVSQLDVDAEEDAIYLPMGLGMASASRDGFRYHSMVEENRYHAGGTYQNPALTSGNRLALIYDRGGENLSVVTSYSKVWSKTLESTILSASMNRQGDFALVTNETGYRCAVTVYNDKQTMLCKWLTSQHYIMTATVNDDASAFAALCFSMESNNMKTQAMLFRVGEEKAFATVDLQGRNVCSMKYDNSGNLFILCEDGLMTVDSKGSIKFSRSFDTPLTGFYHREGMAPLMVFTRAAEQGELVHLLMLSDDGKVLCDTEYAGTYLDVAADEDTVHLLLSDKLISFEPDSNTQTETPCSGAIAVLAGSGGEPILRYTDRAEKLRLPD